MRVPDVVDSYLFYTSFLAAPYHLMGEERLGVRKDNIENNKLLVFFVQDSTGKRYEVKTKKKASEYMK